MSDQTLIVDTLPTVCICGHSLADGITGYGFGCGSGIGTYVLCPKCPRSYKVLDDDEEPTP
jgi:hypothetical protein